MRLSWRIVTAAMRGPFVAGHGTVAQRDLVLVSLHSAGGGPAGYGEAAPLESYDGVGVDAVCDALEDCRPALAGADGLAHGDIMAACAELAVLPQALAAVDLALWSLRGRLAGQPVWRLLGAAPPPPVTVNWTIAADDRAGAAREAAVARAAGFGTIKVKVGIGDDAGRLAAVRAAAGPAMAIRIDANGAWTPEQAQAALALLAPVGIELCEEPVSGAGAIAALRAASPIPLALDESATGADVLTEPAAADLICLKIARCGGISATIAAAGAARAAGYEVFLASTLDGPLGIAAALHAAAVIVPTRACGLATLGLFADRPDPLPARAGAIAVPAGPGLGEGLLEWYGADTPEGLC